MRKNEDLLQTAREERAFCFSGEIHEFKWALAMMRKSGKKGKKAAVKQVKKAAAKKGRAKGKVGKKERDSGEVRQQCNKLVKAEATELTAAVIEEGRKGQLGPVKFLFEMANIFPQAEDGSQTSAREESLAETLLNRLGIPTSPVVADEYEKEANEVTPARLADEGAEQKEAGEASENSGAEELANTTVAAE